MQFAITAGGFDEAKLLAMAWCHKVQAGYDAYKAGLLRGPAQVTAFLNSYTEPADFSSLMEEASPAVRALGNKIRKIRCLPG